MLYIKLQYDIICYNTIIYFNIKLIITFVFIKSYFVNLSIAHYQLLIYITQKFNRRNFLI